MFGVELFSAIPVASQRLWEAGSGTRVWSLPGPRGRRLGRAGTREVHGLALDVNQSSGRESFPFPTGTNPRNSLLQSQIAL